MTHDWTDCAGVTILAWPRADGAFGVTIGSDTYTIDLEDAVRLHDKLCEALSVRRKVLEREAVGRN